MLHEGNEDIRLALLDELNRLKEVDRSNSGNVFSNVLFTAKSQEFTGVFSALERTERWRAFDLLSGLDPSNTRIYEKLKR